MDADGTHLKTAETLDELEELLQKQREAEQRVVAEAKRELEK